LYKRKIAAALFAVLAMAVVVAGCGGGGDTTGGGSTTDTTGAGTSESDSGGAGPTKAAFIKEADKVCGGLEEELGEELSAFAKEHDIPISKEEPTSDQEAELFQEVVLPNIARQGEEIAALTPPSGDEETIEELTSTLEDEVSEAEDAGGGPGDDTLAGATKIANEYGFKTCGS
jgi:hypothetical protein